MVQSLGFAAKEAVVGSRRELASKALSSRLRLFFIFPHSEMVARFEKSYQLEPQKHRVFRAIPGFSDYFQIREIPVTRTGISTW